MKKIFLITIIIASVFELSYSQTSRTKEEWETYFKGNISSLDPIEGLWNATVTPTMTDNTTGRQLGNDQTATNLFAIIKGKTGFDAICIENELPWITTFEKSANSKVYFYKETVKGTRSGVNVNTVLSDLGTMELDFYYTDDFKQKLFPNSTPSFNRSIKMRAKSIWIKLNLAINKY